MRDSANDRRRQTPTTTPAEMRERSRNGLSAGALRRGIIDHLRYSIGRPAAALTPEHFYRATALAVRDRMQDNRVASTQTSLDLGRKVTCYLSAEFLMGPQLGNNLLNLGIEEAGARRARRARRRVRGGAGLRGGAGAGQRRPRPAGGLLPRLAGHARAPGHRLRHPLRVRHLRSGDPRRLAGREDRQLARQREPVGDPQARRELSASTGAATPSTTPTTPAPTASAGCRGGSSRASPTTPRSRATA